VSLFYEVCGFIIAVLVRVCLVRGITSGILETKVDVLGLKDCLYHLHFIMVRSVLLHLSIKCVENWSLLQFRSLLIYLIGISVLEKISDHIHFCLANRIMQTILIINPKLFHDIIVHFLHEVFEHFDMITFTNQGQNSIFI